MQILTDLRFYKVLESLLQKKKKKEKKLLQILNQKCYIWACKTWISKTILIFQIRHLRVIEIQSIKLKEIINK